MDEFKFLLVFRHDPEKLNRPFDQGCEGFLFGEEFAICPEVPTNEGDSRPILGSFLGFFDYNHKKTLTLL